MSDIFISYARDERSHAKALAKALENFGFSVWWDPQIAAGMSWANEIEEQLDAASCVIVLWSMNSVKSRWVVEEAAYARESKKLIPVLIEDVDPPIGFRNLQSAVLTDWRGELNNPVFQQVVETVSEIIK